MANSTKFGGAYKATFQPYGATTAVSMGSTSQGFLMTYNLLHAPFSEDFFGQLATVGTILKGAECTLTLVGLDWASIVGTTSVPGANMAFSAIGGIGNIGAPFQYVGRDGYDLSGELIMTPFLSSYATNLPALVPTLVTFLHVLPVGPIDINLNSDLRVVGLYCLVFPDATTQDIFTWVD